MEQLTPPPSVEPYNFDIDDVDTNSVATSSTTAFEEFLQYNDLTDINFITKSYKVNVNYIYLFIFFNLVKYYHQFIST